MLQRQQSRKARGQDWSIKGSPHILIKMFAYSFTQQLLREEQFNPHAVKADLLLSYPYPRGTSKTKKVTSRGWRVKNKFRKIRQEKTKGRHEKHKK